MLHFTKTLCTSLIAVWLVLFVVSEARADTVVFSNFGPGMSFVTDSGFTVIASNVSGVQIPAVAFTPSGDFIFTSAQLGVGSLSGPNLLQVILMTSSGGAPGNIIEIITLTNVPAFASGGIALANSALHPVLTSGTQYWLVAFPPDPDTFMAWNFSLIDFSSPVLGSFTDLTGPWLSIQGPGGPRPAFQINGEPIPEPTTMLLLGTGLAALGTTVRKRRAMNSRRSRG